MEKTTKKTSASSKISKEKNEPALKNSAKSSTKASTKISEPKKDKTLKIAPKENPAKAKRAQLAKAENSGKNSAKNLPKNSTLLENSAKNSAENSLQSSETSKSNITNTKLISALKVIENISHTLGISDRERINFDIEQVSENELKIRIVNAAANFHTPWFAIKNEEPYIFMPAEILDVVFRMLKTAQKESFELKLERSIWQNMPIDFGDVWRVAMDELMKSEFKKEPDLDKLIAKIKREHPNLFVDMNQIMG